MSPAGMAVMWIAATLAHVLPSLRLRIRRLDSTLLEALLADEVVAELAGTH